MPNQNPTPVVVTDSQGNPTPVVVTDINGIPMGAAPFQVKPVSDSAGYTGIFASGTTAPFTTAKSVLIWKDDNTSFREFNGNTGASGGFYFNATGPGFMQILSTCGVAFGALSSAPADNTLILNNMWLAWIDTSGSKIMFKVKDNSGTIKSGSVSLT